MIKVNERMPRKINLKHLLSEMVAKIDNVENMGCSFSSDTPMLTIADEDARTKHMTKGISIRIIHVILDWVIPTINVTSALTPNLLL